MGQLTRKSHYLQVLYMFICSVHLEMTCETKLVSEPKSGTKQNQQNQDSNRPTPDNIPNRHIQHFVSTRMILWETFFLFLPSLLPGDFNPILCLSQAVKLAWREAGCIY